MSYLFSSESVSEGHPDKVADQISDAILDAMLTDDPNSRVAVETMVTTGLVILSGEVTTNAYVDVQEVAREVIRNIGYTDPELRFDADSCGVLTSIHDQSPDIAQGVDMERGLHKDQGAGDQGMMFGYATKETAEFMPMALSFSHALMHELASIRKTQNLMPYLRPDSKAQVTVEYEDDGKTVKRIHTIVVSTQHAPDVEMNTIRKDVQDILIPRVIPSELLDDDVILHVNPTGQFVIGGPHGDTGLTGRKIIVDTYGGKGAHGGGAFSGKDPSKVDRSAAYAARHVAKNIIGADLADEVLVQVAYAIGVADPISIHVESYGTGKLPDSRLIDVVQGVFDLRPRAIIERLNLLQPGYVKTAAYGHFGRPGFSWEKLDFVDQLAERAARMG
ncbi:MAG: methionine adenosyltransferase [Bacteroidetes bacterium]|nr:methionine adenosyltransferase [Bacteroidota bacterium]